MLKRYTGGEWVEQGGGGGTNDYADLSNKPKINNTTLSGNKTSSDLGLQPAINGSAKVNADYIDDSTSTNKFVTASDKTNWNAKLGPGDTYTKQELDDEFTEINNAIDAVEAGAAAGATALQPEDVASTYSSSGTAPINGTGVAAALSTLDVTAVGGSGKYLSQISEVDGKIVPVVQTMDSTPTEESYKAISSDGVWADQQRQDLALTEVVDAGAKNLVQIMQDSLSIYNIIFSVNKLEGTITITGTGSTASAYKAFRFFGDPDNTGWSYGIPIPKGTYVLSGLPSGASQTGVRYILGITTSQSDTRTTTQIWDGDYVFTISNDTTRIDLSAYVPAGQDLSTPYVFKPMICSKSQWDVSHQFEPYALSNPVITPALIEQVDNGAKNRFDPASAWDSKTAYGVTITRNGDVYSIASGTTQSGDNNFINMGYQANTNLIPAGDWVLSFNTPQQNVRFQVCWNGTLQANASFGNNCFFTVPKNTTDSWFRILLKGSTNMAGTSFKIMLCPRILWDVSHTYEPYALPNPTLTPAVIKAVDEGAKNLLQLFQLGSSNANVGNPCTSQGVEYEIQPDGTITAYRKSSASAGAYIFLYKNGAIQNVSEFFDGKHIWSGNPPQYPDGGVSVWYKIGSGSNTTMPNGSLLPNANGEAVQIGFQISTALSPAQSNPIIFKPMICTAEDWAASRKYTPYALSNPVLTQEVNWNVNQGVKNLIKLNPDTYTSGNVVVELNDDGTVSVSLSSGSTANTTFSRAIKTITHLRDLDLILNGCPSGGNYSSGYALYISDDSTTKEKDEGKGVLVPKNTAVTTSYLALIVRSGTAISGTLTFKPMLRSASIIDSTFQPYALPNSTLTADITSLKHMVDPRSQSQVSGGNLDNITVSEIRVYIAPSGLPTGVSASSVCIVETLVVDSNSAYQIITLLSNQGTAQERSYPTYKRVKVGGVWYDWKLIIS